MDCMSGYYNAVLLFCRRKITFNMSRTGITSGEKKSVTPVPCSIEPGFMASDNSYIIGGLIDKISMLWTLFCCQKHP
jgi:hypothetical protein